MLGSCWPRVVLLRKGASLAVSLVLFCSAILPYFLFYVRPAQANQSALMRPSKRPVFVRTTGDIEVNVTVPGFAVRIEIPREFVPVRMENDTSFVWSTITEDYWYYNVTDGSLHYPYDPNAPWYVIVWSQNLTGFSPPQIVRFKDLRAPEIAGVYNVTVYVSTALSPYRKPIFSQTPIEVLTILVCMSRDWATVYGYVVDLEPPSRVVKAKGVVYGENQETKEVARAFINSTTGFFNLTGLRPGTYKFKASAGYFPVTGFAYSLTTQTVPPLQLFERGSIFLNMTVDRGARIRGSIKYHLSDPNRSFIQSLSHPWLVSLGYSAKGILNWTVEAYSSQGRLVATDFGNTLNAPNGEDPFLLVVGKRWKYVGVDPVGTEFCGIDIGEYDLVAHVFAYVRERNRWPPSVVQINQKGQSATVNIDLTTGGVISGTIRFVQPGTATVVLETPRQAESRVLGTATGRVFGGHILVESYNITSRRLTGIHLRNGTSASGVTLYADQGTLRFYILGFSEHYNRTFSGIWKTKDYGLDEGSYSLKVQVRGYLQASNWNVTLGLGSNATVYVDMKAAGAVRATLYSAISYPYTYTMQMLTRWIFFEAYALMGYRARVYYYNELGVSLGYSEVIMAPGQPGVTSTTATMTFAGMNYELAELIYHGWMPTSLSKGTYSLKAFAYGYVQASWPKVFVEYYSAMARINMLVACEAQATVTLTRGGLFYRLAENVSFRVQLVDTYRNLRGGQIGNAAVGAASVSFSCRGFGGAGHFFYVTPDGTRWNDCGIDIGNYTIVLERFGYLNMFERTSVQVQFVMLNSEIGFYWRTYLLNKIFGIVYGLSDDVPIRLSWATVYVESFGEAPQSLDGAYWVFMPDGESYVRCSLRGYVDERMLVIAVGGSTVELNFILSPR